MGSKGKEKGKSMTSTWQSWNAPAYGAKSYSKSYGKGLSDYEDDYYGGGKGYQGTFGAKAKGYGKDKGKDKGKDFGKGKGKDKGKKGKGKSKTPGHMLKRTVIEGEPLGGTVLEWKGKYGWIEPSEPIEHEKADKHKGRIWVSKDDIGDLEELTEGCEVSFQIWEDASGIGAAEVVQF